MLYNQLAKKIIEKLLKDLNSSAWRDGHLNVEQGLQKYKEDMEKTVTTILKHQIPIMQNIATIRTYLLSHEATTKSNSQLQNEAIVTLNLLEEQLQ